MQNNFQISVVIPNYNRQEKLRTAVQSCLNQTFPVHEVLVCDDGSTDDSKNVVESFKDARVKWIDCGKNGRPAIPRNIGIKKSSGNWIAFLDNDDEWLSEKIETQVHLAQQNHVDFVCSNANRISENKNLGPLSSLKNDQMINFFNLVTSNSVICSSVLVKKELLEKFSLFPEEAELRALEDYGCWLRIATRNTIYYSNKCLLNYTDESSASIRQGSLTTEQQLKLLFTSFKKWAKANQGLCDEYMLLLMEHVFVLKFMSKTQRYFYKLFN
ncbi:MAG: glycosyltransferase [Bacteroidetes bacterium]|nr:glycosyltransferase [Bacteroidota bacterium]